jgi:ubiquinone/menaquinone biosynthesis C-methylase UbiE
VSRIASVARSKAQARATYDKRAGGYERLEGRFERHARVIGEHLLAVQPGERVLEIGSGPGASLSAFARATGAGGHVVGLDLAPKMHHVATERIVAEDLAGRVSLVGADAAHLPLHTGSFAAAFASFTLELFDTPELPIVLGELRRVLRSDGRLAIVALALTEPPSFMEHAYLVVHRLLPRLADCRPIPLGDLLTESGFDIVGRRRCDIVGIPTMAIVANLSGTST